MKQLETEILNLLTKHKVINMKHLYQDIEIRMHNNQPIEFTINGAVIKDE